MSSLRVTAGLLTMAVLAVPVSLAADVDLQLETYKPRDIVVAQYGPREGEFGLRHYDWGNLGALFFCVGSNGAVYIYDGVKGNIKVYGNEGAFVGTIKGVPKQDDPLLPDDMALAPNGDIYILCETSGQDERSLGHDTTTYRVFVTAAGADTVRSVPVAVGRYLGLLTNGDRLHNAAQIRSDRAGSVYVDNLITSESFKLVDEGKVLSDSAQWASSSHAYIDRPSLAYPGRNGREEMADEPVLAHETGRVTLASRCESYLGTDSLGYIYNRSLVDAGQWALTMITKWRPSSPAVLAVVSPMPELLTRTYGKGRWVVAADGSLYELIPTFESVRVRKWERIN